MTISGEVGTAPEVKWKSGMSAGKIETETIEEGDGPELKDADDVLAQWSDVIVSVEVFDRVVRVEGSSVEEYREFLARLLLELLARTQA